MEKIVESLELHQEKKRGVLSIVGRGVGPHFCRTRRRSTLRNVVCLLLTRNSLWHNHFRPAKIQGSLTVVVSVLSSTVLQFWASWYPRLLHLHYDQKSFDLTRIESHRDQRGSGTSSNTESSWKYRSRLRWPFTTSFEAARRRPQRLRRTDMASWPCLG